MDWYIFSRWAPDGRQKPAAGGGDRLAGLPAQAGMHGILD